MDSNASLTKRLQLFMEGDAAAADALLNEILPKLRDIALRELKRERYIAPISKTELINELWLSNLAKGGWQIRNRGHFYALASMAMRRVLVDMARKRLTLRRGGRESTVSLDETEPVLEAPAQDAEQIVEIGILMDRLDSKDADAARMLDMHYFSGFTLEEIASETGLTVRQVRLRWERGMKWLKRMLYATKRDAPSPSPDASV
jgi:RNA polymerase sigma factor (TIGR02999 family)